MRRDLLEKSLISGRLHLSFWKKVNHYFSVVFLGFLAILPTGKVIYENENVITNYELLHFLIVGSVGVFIAWLQRKRLNFKIHTTTLDQSDLDHVIYDVAKKLEWFVIEHSDRYIIAKTFPGFWSGSWGEHITILFDNSRVLANSICDPAKSSSLVSIGRNRNNIETLLQQIKKVEVSTS